MMDKSLPGDRPFALACLPPPLGEPERPLLPSYGTAHNDRVRGTPALPLARTL